MGRAAARGYVAQSDACAGVAGVARPADQEPNDTPDEAAPASGPLCIEGEPPDDDQDLFLWEFEAAGQPRITRPWRVLGQRRPPR